MRDSAGDRAMRAAQHAARWRPGMQWEEWPVLGVAVVSHWHVVLRLPWGHVELDPQDQVVAKRRNDACDLTALKESLAADCFDWDDKEVDDYLRERGLDPEKVGAGKPELLPPPPNHQVDLFNLIPTQESDDDA